MSATGYCRATDYDPMRGHVAQCESEHYRDGYCLWHHPDAVAVRRAKAKARAEQDERSAMAAAESRARARIKAEGMRDAADDLDESIAGGAGVAREVAVWTWCRDWLRERAENLEAGL